MASSHCIHIVATSLTSGPELLLFAELRDFDELKLLIPWFRGGACVATAGNARKTND